MGEARDQFEFAAQIFLSFLIHGKPVQEILRRILCGRCVVDTPERRAAGIDLGLGRIIGEGKTEKTQVQVRIDVVQRRLAPASAQHDGAFAGAEFGNLGIEIGIQGACGISGVNVDPCCQVGHLFVAHKRFASVVQ